MLRTDNQKKLTLMGIKFATEPEGGAPAGGGTPTPADAAAAAEATRLAAEAAAAKPAEGAPAPAPQGETPEQTIARLTAENQTLAREKENVRIQKEGELKKEAKRTELLNLAGVLGIEVKDPTKETLESLTEKLTGRALAGDNTTTEAQSEARNAKMELAIYKTAGTEKVNADKLANSISFQTATKDLDPTAADFNEKLKAAMQAELKKDPSIAISGGSGTSGADQYGGAGGGQEVTAEQFAAMTIADKTKLFQTNPALFARLSA